jgi:hypothetical protein
VVVQGHPADLDWERQAARHPRRGVEVADDPAHELMGNRDARNPDVPGLERERPVAGRKDPDAGTDIGPI